MKCYINFFWERPDHYVLVDISSIDHFRNMDVNKVIDMLPSGYTSFYVDEKVSNEGEIIETEYGKILYFKILDTYYDYPQFKILNRLSNIDSLLN